jgi:hypothetical protein
MKVGKVLSATACELGFAGSTTNTIVKDAIRIKEHVKGMAMMLMTITKKRGGSR